MLEYLMGDGATRGVVSDRDELVAATVIQWLGSPVGQGFLRDVNSLPNSQADRPNGPVLCDEAIKSYENYFKPLKGGSDES